MTAPEPTYLGDGLYAAFDGLMVRIFATDGVTITNVVYLEPEVLNAFMRFAQTLRSKKQVSE